MPGATVNKLPLRPSAWGLSKCMHPTHHDNHAAQQRTTSSEDFGVLPVPWRPRRNHETSSVTRPNFGRAIPVRAESDRKAFVHFVAIGPRPIQALFFLENATLPELYLNTCRYTSKR